MSIEVQQFLNDAAGNFTETAPRPPVPGEENELQSNGGTSTRSSGSYKSHLSGKSHTSAKSGTSHRSENSPAATPRRSNLDKTGGSLSCSITRLNTEDIEAPLGFEPEGSAANSPPFTENSTPPYLKWAENLNYLLNDGDGVKLFQQFLYQEHCPNTLDFWFACRGLKMVPSASSSKIHNLVKLIYRKYIKGDQLNLKSEIKKSIADKLYKKDSSIINQSVFNEAQKDVENSMRNDTYPLFLKSDLYVQYVQCGGESPKSNTSSGSTSVRLQGAGPLPTLHEGEELRQEDINTKIQNASLTLTPTALIATQYKRAALSTARRTEGISYPHPAGVPPGRIVNPYHVSYAPVSAHDSELQSLSSDALTDDTMSLTDSSVDGRETAPYGSKKWKLQRKAMHRNAQLNKNTELNQGFIPRTERAPKDRNVAETDPPKFAAMLIERLEKVREEQDTMERMHESINSVDMTLPVYPVSVTMEEEDLLKVSMSHGHANKSSSSMSSLNALIATAMAETQEDNAQSILEEHCSRIWDSSAGQTPSRSPGRHSPKSWSPDRERSFARRVALSGPSLNLSGTTNHKGHHHKRKDKDSHFMSTLSFDSGMGEDKSYNIHYHHHHNKEAKSKQQHLEAEAQRRSMVLYKSEPQLRPYMDQLSGQLWEEPVRGRSRDAKRSNAKKSSDSCSNIDSGVSLMYDISPQVPNIHDPTNEKVLAWMLENDKLSSGTTQYSTDSSDKGSSHKRSSHKSISSTTSPSYKSTGKRPVQYNATRSGSLDRSGFQSILGAEYAAPVRPSQPIVQDPSMPLLNPPNPTTQLEEAKRRLEDEKTRQLLKSRSFSGASSKDKRGMMLPPAYLPMPRSLSTSKSIPPTQPLDLSTEDLSSTIKSEKRTMKKPSSSAPTTPAGGESTIVGYYYCSEPIPYRSTLPGKHVTLAMFKQLVTKKGNYRYFFKKASDEFDSGVILEEVTDDNALLPLWEGKVVGKVEKIE